MDDRYYALRELIKMLSDRRVSPKLLAKLTAPKKNKSYDEREIIAEEILDCVYQSNNEYEIEELARVRNLL